jgi:hypothetical protein
MHTSHSGSSVNKTAAAFLAGAATASVAIGYMVFGKKIKRQIKAKWDIEKARMEVLARMVKTKNLTEAKYSRIVDDILEDWDVAKRLTGYELSRVGSTLKDTWEEMKTRAEEAAKEASEKAEEEEG